MTLAYDDRGSGRAVVLIHGHPFDRSLWRPQVASLSASWRVVAPDLRGFGESPVTQGTVSMGELADDVWELLGTLGIEDAAVVGLSMGGLIAMEMAIAHPQRVWALGLVATTVEPVAEGEPERRLALADRVEAAGMGVMLEYMRPQFGPDPEPRLVEEIAAMIARNHPAGAAAALRGRAARPDYRPGLRELAIPAFVCAGTHDVWSTPAVTQEIVDCLRAPRAVTLEHVGHLPNREAEERFNAELSSFLRRGVSDVRLQLDRIRAAVGGIDPAFLDTPALPCAPLGRALGCSLTLKVETLNPVRSFKGRGTETVAAFARETGATRVVCASAGNLGQALAYSGRRRGLDVTVVAANTANPLKLRQIATFGADVRLEGEDIEDARLKAREIADTDGAYLVEDSLDLATCEGAATIGLELVRDDPQLDVVLVALGGGAMASGVAYTMRELAEHVEVIGIQPVGAPAMALSFRQRAVIETDRIDTIADGVAGRCPIPEVLEDLLVVLDDVMLVQEDSIKAGMRLLYEHAGLVVEPSAALGVAAVLEAPERFSGRNVTTILCGSNVGPADFARWVLEPAAR